MSTKVEVCFKCTDNRDIAEIIICVCKNRRNGESCILSGDLIGMKEVSALPY